MNGLANEKKKFQIQSSDRKDKVQILISALYYSRSTSAIAHKASAERGVSSEGFNTTVQPAASAGPVQQYQP